MADGNKRSSSGHLVWPVGTRGLHCHGHSNVHIYLETVTHINSIVIRETVGITYGQVSWEYRSETEMSWLFNVFRVLDFLTKCELS